MSTKSPLEITRRWLQILADADYDAWEGIAASDLVIHTPYATPGLPKKSEGRQVCLDMAREYGRFLKHFAYHDVDLHATDDPGLVMGTARSEAQTPSGARYANEYCVIARVKDGRISEYWEYFDPQRVIPAAGEVNL